MSLIVLVSFALLLTVSQPALDVKTYKALSSEDRAIIDSIITIKQKAPTLTVEGDFS